ncbi:hypothetical protein FQA39_LY13235 [Lamprigera yunnana]|nr:hypothetical protein FQA39_LY13235 [Lamprigera yunnana]
MLSKRYLLLLPYVAYVVFSDVSAAVKHIEATPDTKRLYDDLLSNYNRLIRPVVNNSETLTVWLGLKLSQLIEMNLKNQIMTTNLWVVQWLKRSIAKMEYNGVINDFVNVNLNLTTSGVPNEDDVWQSVRSKHVKSKSREEEEHGDFTTVRITLDQTENLLINFIESNSASSGAAFKHLGALRNIFVDFKYFSKYKQFVIKDFSVKQ